MGQYYHVVNVDKREYIAPHAIGDGLRLRQQLNGWTARALYLLLCPCATSEREHITDSGHAGRWAGDRVIVVGDYSRSTDWPENFRASHDPDSIYDAIDELPYTNIAPQVRCLLASAYDIEWQQTDAAYDFWNVKDA